MKKYISLTLALLTVLATLSYFPSNFAIAVLLGDMNGDGYVSSADFVTMQNYLINGTKDADSIKIGDLNGDGNLNSADVLWFSSALVGSISLSCNHIYSDWTESGEYNCEGNMITTRTCTKCGETEESSKQSDTEFRSLDGKTVMFIGNSFIYYGFCVNKGDYKSLDYGYFYQHCKANGENVNVYDFVWGGKNLDYIYTNYLKSASKSILNSVDYVFMSEAGENNSNLLEHCKNIMALFPAKTEFYYLCHAYTYQKDHKNIKNAFGSLQSNGVKIVNWGQLAYNVWKGTEAVPGATLSYSKTTFINNKLDTHHQNMLSGYITSLMAYCAVTGRSAVGQTYTYCRDTAINADYDAASYKSSYYDSAEGETNFDKVFASKSDMLGLQQLMDKYLKKYNISVISEGRHCTEPYYENSDFDNALISAGLKAKKCTACGKVILSSGGSMGNNIMYISPETVANAGYNTVKEYMTAGLGNVFYKTTSGWGRKGYTTIQGMAAACDGERSCKTATDGTELYWKIKSLSAAYDADGNTVTSGESYISLIGYDMTNAVNASGIGIFFGKYAAPTAFKVLGGTTNSDGTITWKELTSFDEATDSYFVYDKNTKAYFADFDTSKIDCLQLAVVSSDTGLLHISEIELY